MPKLLDFIKEKGLSHEDVIKYLSEMDETEDSEEEEEVEDDIEEDDADTDIEDDTEIDDDKEEPKIVQLTEVELSKLIIKAVEQSKKAKRKAPSKGKTKGTGTPQNRIYSREEQFEVMF